MPAPVGIEPSARCNPPKSRNVSASGDASRRVASSAGPETARSPTAGQRSRFAPSNSTTAPFAPDAQPPSAVADASYVSVTSSSVYTLAYQIRFSRSSLERNQPS